MTCTHVMCFAGDVLRCITGFGVVCLHVNLYRGGTSRMCFARDVLRCVMGVGVVCLILTSSWMENETCVFKC